MRFLYRCSSDSTSSIPPYASPFTPHVFLLPARRQDRLHLCRLLIDRLIPREAGLLREPSHGLNQLIDLCTEQHLAIAGLNGFRLIRRTAVPVLNRDMIC